MEGIYPETRGHQDKVQQRSTLHPMLANAQLQTENQASEEKP